MFGYKVVNYNVWEALPDIFDTIKDAKDAKSKWCFKDGAIIEQFKSKNNKAKRIFERNQ